MENDDICKENLLKRKAQLRLIHHKRQISISAMNPWLSRRVLAYAHQGGAKEAPSSTLYAMKKAIENGATALELDVHRTLDGHLVVCHDPTVNRTSNGNGAIAKMTLDQLQSLDNAYYWIPGKVVDHSQSESAYPLRGKAPADRELSFATLEEVLLAFPHIPINIDIKQTAPNVIPYEQQLAELLLKYNRKDDVIVASFNDAALDAFNALKTGIGTACGPRSVASFAMALAQGESVKPYIRQHVAIQVPRSWGGTTLVTRESVAAAHDAGLAVHVFDVDEEAEMDSLIDIGVDGIMTDFPSKLAKVMKAKKCSIENLNF